MNAIENKEQIFLKKIINDVETEDFEKAALIEDYYFEKEMKLISVLTIVLFVAIVLSYLLFTN